MARFCGNCGSALPPVCPTCSARIVAGQRFCTSCGSALAGPLLPSANTSADSATERKLMTVMFCDLVGSSKLASRLDPEEFATLLVAYRERCAATVAQRGGYVSRYVGDGVLACFGYPRAIGRDAQAAVSCGLAIAKEIRALADTTSLPGGQELAVRIGIDTGVVLAGRLGPDNAMELDALVGTAPHMAARLQSLASPNTVVIGEGTHELVAEDFVCEELPTQYPFFPNVAARAFLVSSEKTRRTDRLMLTKRRTPLCGRQTELVQLRERWSQTLAGKGQTVLLSGEAGIGKSRLAQELLDHISKTPHTLILLACKPSASSTPLFPVLEELREAVAAIHEATGASTEQILADIVGSPGPGDEPAQLVLSEALGFGVAQLDLAPAVRRRLLMQALQAWLIGSVSDKPLLILAEDLHWSDPSLLELLQGVVALLPNRRAMLLATYRTDFILQWPDRPTTLRLTLSSLERPDAERLLMALARDENAATREIILARSDGVPLFLEEFTLAAGAAALPRTLQQLFTARLDALGDAKRLAQCAAVLAPLLDLDLLAALTDLPEEVIETWLARLVEAEVLIRTAPQPTAAPTYAFRHALLQQAAAESTMIADRRALHERSAGVLMKLRPPLLVQRPEIIAEHYYSAANFLASAPLFGRAARSSLAAAALEEAEGHVRRALAALAELSSPDIAEIELDMRVLLGNVLIARRGYASEFVQEAFESALTAVERTRDEIQTLPALRGLASFYQVRGPLSRAEVICNRLVTVAERTGEVCMLVDAWRRRGWNRGCMGLLTDAETDLTAALSTFDPRRQEEHIAIAGHDPRVLALANLCWLAPYRHGISVAIQRAEAAAQAAQASPHPVSACYGLVFASLILQQAGHLDEALRLATRALTIAKEKGFVYWVAMGNVAVGYDQVMRRADLTTGLETIRNGLAIYRETQGELLRPFIISLLADGELALGRTDAAQSAIAEATEVAEALGAAVFLPDLLLRRARSSADAAERRMFLEKALKTARAQGADAVADAAANDMNFPSHA
jgi:class 3 adenylate cyclase/tetratricopeptide (TPR) repeat protein